MLNNVPLSVVMFDAAYPPPVIGGKEKQAHLLAKELVSLGVKVHVISCRHKGNIRSSYFEGVYVDRLRQNIFLPFTLFFKLLKSRMRCRILHIHTPSRIGRIATIFGKFLGFSVVFKFPGQSLIKYTGIVDRLSWNIVLKFSSALVVLESDTYEKLCQMEVDPSRIKKMSNGVILGQKNVLKSHSVIQIIFVGRLVELKRCVDLINACSLLKAKGVKFSLRIVGEGPERKMLELLIVDLGLECHVVFEGHVENTVSIMAEADILVLPSRTEGMSNVILEAMSIGLPVISTDVGAARTLLGECGLQFTLPPFRPDLLSEILENLINDDQLRFDYSENLFLRCRKKFSINAISKEYKKMYDRL